MSDDLFKPKAKSSAVDYVINEIKRLLIDGKLKPGDRIPSEYEIAEGLHVSRGSVRSAMKVFESFGIVDIRVGDGTYICKSLNENSLNPLLFSFLILNPSMDALIEFRNRIEVDILDLIMQNDKLRDEVLPLLKDNLDLLLSLQKTDATSEELAQVDMGFHNILASHCGNIVFETVYRFVFDFFYPRVLESHIHQKGGAAAAEVHEKIHNALKERDINKAKDAVFSSTQVWRNLVK